jgi:dTDP-4-amino-4,6-dideoxygalactose transaminase
MTDAPFLPQANPGASYAAQRDEIDAAVARVLAGGRYILGEEVAAFEAEFAAYLGVEQAVGVANGTDAIELALRACQIGPGQAVIAPSHTAVATIAAIERAGARPVLIDVDPLTYTIAAADVEAVLGSRADFGGCRPAAVIPVHLYGNPAEMPAILDVAARQGLRVIEDCAQAHGARLGGRRTGTFGDLAAFSFYPTKNLGAFGDGGLVATRDPQLAKRVRALREYGWVQRSVSDFPGINSRLDEIQAAILRTKLARLDADNLRRIETARRYSAGLNRPDIGLPACSADAEHVFHQFVIRVPNDRDGFREALQKRGIGTAVHYPVPVHRQPAYRDRGLHVGPLPRTDKLCAEIVSLPMFPQLTDADVDRVIAAIGEWTQERMPPRGPST